MTSSGTGTGTGSERSRRAVAVVGVMEPLLGAQVARALVTQFKDLPAVVDMAGVWEWLRSGPTLKIACRTRKKPGDVGGHPQQEFRFPHHRVQVFPDGRLVALNHSEDPSLDQIEMMGALGSPLETCLLLPLLWSSRETPGWLGTSNNRERLMTAYAMVRWSARVVADEDLAGLGPVLRAGLTPDQWAPWARDGWSAKQAWQFLVAKASPERSLPFKDAGLFTVFAAALAARGDGVSTHAEWMSAGMPFEERAQWFRLFPDEPGQAREMHALGFSAMRVWRLCHDAAGGLAEQVEWAEAGVPGDDVSGWMQASLVMETAVGWARLGLDLAGFRSLRLRERALGLAEAGSEEYLRWQAFLPERDRCEVDRLVRLREAVGDVAALERFAAGHPGVGAGSALALVEAFWGADGRAARSGLQPPSSAWRSGVGVWAG